MAGNRQRLVQLNSMSQSHNLQVHIGQLEEIRAILNAMKNLAFMEIHKLSRYQTHQGKAVANIEEAALDFLSFYPEFTVEKNYAQHLCIVVGSERGFCGDFNESLIEAANDGYYTGIIAIGNRLINRLLEINRPIAAEITGASIAEEAPSVINQLIETINNLSETNSATGSNQPDMQLTVLYHAYETGRICQRLLFPPFLRQGQASVPFRHPPELNLDPGDFYTDLIHHYLFAVLHEVIYNSLIAENHNRLQHLDGAVNHLDDETVSLRRKLQNFRQEEITEEIEVILLNSGSP